MNDTDKKLKELDELFTRGVGEFIDPEGTFRKNLEAKIKGTYEKDIVIKFGIDPTRPDIHLGHAVVLHKLRKFQNLGCKVIFLIGDFTAQIGDPTGKSKVRPEVSLKETQSNTNSYITQIPKILKIEPTTEDKEVLIIRDENNFIIDSPWFSWMRNAEWFDDVVDITTDGASIKGLTIKDNTTGGEIKIQADTFLGKAALYENTRIQQRYLKRKNIKSVSFVNVLSFLRGISQAQLIERDMFKDRIKNGEPLFMHEMLYPVVQGIDSDIISDIYGSCDLEVGGTDQLFNMLIGRKVMDMTKKPLQSVMSFKILTGLDGKEKMSKSLNNYIGITDEPNDIYGKVMSIPDSLIESYFELCTFTPLDDIKNISEKISNGSLNPKDAKMDLALQIVNMYYNEKISNEAQVNWEATFSKKEIPEEVPEFFAGDETNLIDIFVEKKIVSSKGDFRRLVEEGAITNLSTDTRIQDTNTKAQEGVYRIGKKRFCKISFK